MVMARLMHTYRFEAVTLLVTQTLGTFGLERDTQALAGKSNSRI